MPRPDSPWYISAAACREYAAILRLDPTVEAHFDLCEDELVAVARVATFHERKRNGLLEYRGNVPTKSRERLLGGRNKEVRLTLLVSTEPRPEGPLPQLVSVLLRGRRGRVTATATVQSERGRTERLCEAYLAAVGRVVEARASGDRVALWRALDVATDAEVALLDDDGPVGRLHDETITCECYAPGNPCSARRDCAYCREQCPLTK